MQTKRATLAHHSWLRFTRTIAAGSGTGAVFMKNVAVSVLHIERGSFRGKWICRGKEFDAVGQEGASRLYPADGEEHVLIGRAGRQGLRYSTLVIPRADMQALAAVEGLATMPDFGVASWPNDVMLQKCLRILASSSVDADADRDEAAGALVLRIAELMGGGVPEWTADDSGFTSCTLGRLVDYIDAHLRIAPTAADMATPLGLSPGHFARKFRRSTRLSLHRFVNQRRIQAAMNLLEDQSVPLSHVARDLGFSSQSHFTRLFSGSVGISPAKYRRQFLVTVA